MPPGKPAAASRRPLPGWVVVLFVVCVLVLCCVGGLALAFLTGNGAPSATISSRPAKSPVRSSAPPSRSPTPSPTVTQSSAPPPRSVGLNEPAHDGQFEFIVTSVRCGLASVGTGTASRAAQGQFCEVGLTVRNVGTQVRTFDGSNQAAFGPGSVRYPDDPTAEQYANRDSRTFQNAVQPGETVNGILVFDVPKGSRIVRLSLHDAFFSGGVTVQVG
jgi:hypothetical protein